MLGMTEEPSNDWSLELLELELLELVPDENNLVR